jgi:hypothetical protein
MQHRFGHPAGNVYAGMLPEPLQTNGHEWHLRLQDGTPLADD